MQAFLSPMRVLLVAVGAAGAMTSGASEPIRYATGIQLGQLENQEVQESSGCAVSLRHPDIFWTHNDSGSGPLLFAFDREGQHRAVCRLTSANAIDWEDMASFSWDGRPYLLIGDVGDNGKLRARYDLYLLPEPRLEDAGANDVSKISFDYADGSFNCEAIAMDSTTREVLLVTKDWLSAHVYSLKIPDQIPAEPLTARRIAVTDLPMVTGMDISADGRRAVLVTYGAGYQYVRGEGESWADAFRRPGAVIELPLRLQGEAICYGRDGRTLYLTSEKLPTPLWEVPADDAGSGAEIPRP